MARLQSPRVQIAPAYKAVKRVQRRPQHPFNLKTKPFTIQPFCLAPVLPGETLNSFMLQSQCWSDPLAAGPMKNIGWWKEYAFFYVKHRDLLGYTAAVDGLGKDLLDMFITNESLSGHVDADGNAVTYCAPGGIDYVLECTKTVVENHFRDEGEAWDNVTQDGLPVARIYGRGRSDWAESLTMQSAYADRAKYISTVDEIDELGDLYREWEAQAEAGLMTMDYDDWLKTYGSSGVVPTVDAAEHPDHHVPELLGHYREFTMPTNTVEPSTGIPATAAGWRVMKKSVKKFRFQEPGWFFGVTWVRPKVYLGKQLGAMSGMMQTRNTWLPAITAHHLDASHVQIVENTGPLKDLVGAETHYWVDLKDLLNHGEQFLNWSPADAVPFVDLPASTGQRRYPSNADCMQFLSDTTNGRFLEDGMVSLNIMGRQQDPLDNLTLGKT